MQKTFFDLFTQMFKTFYQNLIDNVFYTYYMPKCAHSHLKYKKIDKIFIQN